LRRRLLLLGLALSPASSRAEPGTDKLAETVIARLGLVAERRQGFHEVRTLAALSTPLTESGVLIYRRPGHLEKLTLSPRREELVIGGDSVSIRRGDGPARTVALDQSPELALMATTLRAPLDGDLAALRRFYRLEASGDTGHWTLHMIPADERAARVVRRVEMTGENNAIRTMRIEQANGDVQSLTMAP
jgi:hypothetical protein